MTGAAGTVGGLLAGSAVLLAVFTVAFRTRFAPLHTAIRRFNRDVTNPRRQLQRARQPEPPHSGSLIPMELPSVPST